MRTVKEKNAGVANVDFLVHTQDNPEGLEQLILSIAEHYNGANITIADTGTVLDRSAYKKLAEKAAEFGLITRFKAHHFGYNAGIGTVLNRLFSMTNRKYKLTLNDTMVFTKDTDIVAMVDSIETKGVNVGTVNGAEAAGGKEDTQADHVSVFALHHADIYHMYNLGNANPYEELYEFLTNKTTWACIVCAKAVINSSIIKDDEANKTEQDVQSKEKEQGGTGDGDGGTTERNIQSENGKQRGGDTVLPSGENEQTENTSTRRRQGKRRN